MSRKKRTSELVRSLNNRLSQLSEFRRRVILRDLLKKEAVRCFLSGDTCSDVDGQMHARYQIMTEAAVRFEMRKVIQ